MEDLSGFHFQHKVQPNDVEPIVSEVSAITTDNEESIFWKPGVRIPMLKKALPFEKFPNEEGITMQTNMNKKNLPYVNNSYPNYNVSLYSSPKVLIPSDFYKDKMRSQQNKENIQSSNKEVTTRTLSPKIQEEIQPMVSNKSPHENIPNERPLPSSSVESKNSNAPPSNSHESILHKIIEGQQQQILQLQNIIAKLVEERTIPLKCKCSSPVKTNVAMTQTPLIARMPEKKESSTITDLSMENLSHWHVGKSQKEFLHCEKQLEVIKNNQINDNNINMNPEKKQEIQRRHIDSPNGHVISQNYQIPDLRIFLQRVVEDNLEGPNQDENIHEFQSKVKFEVQKTIRSRVMSPNRMQNTAYQQVRKGNHYSDADLAVIAQQALPDSNTPIINRRKNLRLKNDQDYSCATNSFLNRYNLN